MSDQQELAVTKSRLLRDHLYFTRYFFKQRQGIKFRVNWHHQLICDKLQEVIDGKIKNLIINVSPGSSKTEIAIINFISRGLAVNSRARFLHISGSDTLATLNSSTAREIIRSDSFQTFWPLKIADDSDAQARWNVIVDGNKAGGVYATSLGGQITGFRAGHMAPGFQGAIIIDDPIKADSAFSKTKLDAANRALLTTVKSRKANPDTPIIMIMQRIAMNDPTGFALGGNLGLQFDHVNIPAVVDQQYFDSLPEKYQKMIDKSEIIDNRFSYWPYKEKIQDLLSMERGDGADATGNQISKHVFASQYQQNPIALGGNIIKGDHFVRYAFPPKIKWRKIYVDTAQKTKEANDRSCFEEWGYGEDGKAYLLDMIKGKWEAPELQKRAIAFWSKCKARETFSFGMLRKMMVEDKSSGTGLIQTLKQPPYNMLIEPIERNKDKLTRVMDGLPYIESKQVCVPEDAEFTSDFISECESFTADDSHAYDDQVDPMLDAIEDMLSNDKMKQWVALGKRGI